MARLDAMIPSEFAEQRQFVGIEACADRPVTDDAGGTVGHPSAIIECGVRGKGVDDCGGHAERTPGAGRTAIGTQTSRNTRNAAAHRPPTTAKARMIGVYGNSVSGKVNLE